MGKIIQRTRERAKKRLDRQMLQAWLNHDVSALAIRAKLARPFIRMMTEPDEPKRKPRWWMF